jgi:uncharacterized protein YndB with AHSA1/START domain
MIEPVTVSRRIDAPADVLFGILADPRRHPEIDGSTLVREPDGEAKPLTVVGDIFAMRMHNDEMGDYVMASRITEYEPGRRIVWAPVMTRASRPEDLDMVGTPGGHLWGYELTPDGAGATVVTEIFDCSRSPEWLHKATKGGRTWIPAMTATLENLERLAKESDAFGRGLPEVS